MMIIMMTLKVNHANLLNRPVNRPVNKPVKLYSCMANQFIIYSLIKNLIKMIEGL